MMNAPSTPNHEPTASPPPPALDRDLLALLCCPLTRQPLREMSAAEITELKSRTDRDLDSALVTEDGRFAYPVRGGIPYLIADEVIRRR